ncbi:NUDIX hydrolase [Urbifossiella limnaea]|uniref:NUDIX hydrolase n=1 Tax=Urbifossiella limnaea TaxID=2528023 RepID=UPI0011A9044A|nr:NUDIX hydrolase [Urbifossiella limnaea]
MNDASDRATRTWSGDWRNRVIVRVRALGYPSVAAFLESIPAETYKAASDRLGDDVAPIQLELAQFAEARRSGTVRAAAMDSLVREATQHIPGGWPDDPVGHFGLGGVYVCWAIRVEDVQVALRAKADAVWAALTALSPPAGWLPTRVDDPLIVAAFDSGWPP